MKKIEDKEDLSGKKVLLRLDLNVPLQDGEIQDETRIDKIIPTLKFLLKKKSKIIMTTKNLYLQENTKKYFHILKKLEEEKITYCGLKK